MEELIALLKDTRQIEIVLQNILRYVIYIYPGLISIYWYDFLEAKSTKDTKALVIKSFSISYLYNIVLGQFLVYRYYEIVYNVFLIAMSIGVPWGFQKTKYSEWWKEICEKWKIRTCMVTVPFELLKDKKEKSTCLKIYLKDGVTSYVGYMDKYEYESDKEKFIILAAYKKYLYDGNKEQLIIDNGIEKLNQKVFIKYNDIKVIEKIDENEANEIYK